MPAPEMSPELVQLFSTLRRQLTWLEGFGAALQNPQVATLVRNVRRDMNLYERGEYEIRKPVKEESYAPVEEADAASCAAPRSGPPATTPGPAPVGAQPLESPLRPVGRGLRGRRV